MARPGYALFARMQAISPAYSTLYDTTPQIIRSCEPHASTDTFVSRQTVPLYVLILVYQQYVISSTEPRALCTSSIHSSGSANIRNIWSTCGIRSIALPYTTRRVLVLQYWYSHISECVAVKRCRYHAIRGSVVCTWYVSYEYGRYRTLHMVLLHSYRSTLASYDTWSGHGPRVRTRLNAYE